MAAIKKTNAAADHLEQQRTEELQKAEEERRQKVQQAQAKKDELQKKLLQDLKEQSQQIAGKKFGSNQAARRFHSARRHPDAIGWHCNYAEVVHLYENGGPNECHDPSQGGCDFFGTMDDLFKNEYGCYQPK
jgi:vacuolar-type H+-ATPase subunit H